MAKANKELNEQLNSLINYDQEWAVKWRNSSHSDTLYKQLKKNMDSLSLELKKLITISGFLTEEKLGVALKNDTILAFQPPYFIIIIHNFEKNTFLDPELINSPDIFTSLLLKAVKEGKLKPEVFAETSDWGTGINANYGTSSFFNIYKNNMYKSKHFSSKKEITKIESARKEIGLGNMNDYAKKIKYRIEMPNSQFFIAVGIHEMDNFLDKESETNFFQGNDLFLKKISAYKNKNKVQK